MILHSLVLMMVRMQDVGSGEKRAKSSMISIFLLRIGNRLRLQMACRPKSIRCKYGLILQRDFPPRALFTMPCRSQKSASHDCLQLFSCAAARKEAHRQKPKSRCSTRWATWHGPEHGTT